MSFGPFGRSALALTVALWGAGVRPVLAQTDRELAEAQHQTFVVQVDDAIDVANDRDPPWHAPLGRPGAQLWSGMTEVAIVFNRFFGSVVPNDTGVERPSADEHMVDEFVVGLDDRLSFVLMGAANDHVLTPLHFYQQFDGMPSLRYDLLQPTHEVPFRIALTVSPLAGSLTVITRHNGVYDVEQLPYSFAIGGAGGLDIWQTLRLVIFHARVLAIPAVDAFDGAFGVELVEMVQMKWRLTEVFDLDPTWPIDLGLIALHVDRGSARSAVYAWTGDFRSPAELREVWQLMAIIELRVN